MQEENIEFKNIFESVTDPESAKIMKSLSDKLIKAREELETLRASNRIKQANIELLEAENANLKLHKEYDQTLENLILERDRLLEENAKLIAERDDLKTNSENWNYYQNLLKMNGFSGITDLLAKYRSIERERDELTTDRDDVNPGQGCFLVDVAEWPDYDDLRNEVIKLRAEREAMMKQEPHGYVNPDDEWNLRNKGYAQIQPKMNDYSTMALFRSPLPAQQIPEGYAGVKVWIGDKTVVQVVTRELLERSSADELLRRFENARSMLSASQPKGDK